MKPFVMQQHEKDHGAVRELRQEELEAVSGGNRAPISVIQDPIQLPTLTITPNSDGGDDGCDDDWR